MLHVKRTKNSKCRHGGKQALLSLFSVDEILLNLKQRSGAGAVVGGAVASHLKVTDACRRG